MSVAWNAATASATAPASVSPPGRAASGHRFSAATAMLRIVPLPLFTHAQITRAASLVVKERGITRRGCQWQCQVAFGLVRVIGLLLLPLPGPPIFQPCFPVKSGTHRHFFFSRVGAPIREKKKGLSRARDGACHAPE